MAILIRVGNPMDVEAAVSVYERSNLARHAGFWANRATGVERTRANLHDRGVWFVVAEEGPGLVGMASAKPLRGEDGAGAVIPGGCFLGYLFVVPERWGEGIGGVILDEVLTESRRRRDTRLHLLTHADNERAHRLYRSRGFLPTGRTLASQGEWAREI